ncbi:hypothetical protein Q7689_05600 [Nocardiopsis tropica]|uniref:hypothetical protein n=1 Tax=Nocardiopsis tropica TaxID=109330 RepID=UPI002E82AB2D|nr:hypothetical protein [Nocardiopsis tropica]
MATGTEPEVVTWPTLFVAIDWIERHCVIPDKFHAGEPYLLTDEQAWFYANHYRVRPDADVVASLDAPASAFVYRRSLLVRPQKWGKGPLTASQLCLEGVGPAVFSGFARGGERYRCSRHGCDCGWVYTYEPGEAMAIPWPTPLIQVTAFSDDQTDNIYSALKPMIQLGPLAEVIPKVGEEFTRLPGGGQIVTVTSSAQSRLGQRVTFVAQDETGIWTAANKMVKVAETQRRGLAGMGGRAVETTNAWDPSEGSVAQRSYEAKAKDVYRDHLQPPATLSFADRVERRKIYQVVYGDSWWVNHDVIDAEAMELAEKDPAQAERFFGNRAVAGTATWLDPAAWAKRAKPTRVRPHTRIVLGFDGSDVDDWTAIRAETMDGYQFTPVYGPDDQPCIWNPADYGGQVPRAEVSAAMEQIMRRYDVVRLYADPPYWETEVDAWVDQYGEERVIRWHTRRIVQMHAAAERLKTDVAKTGSSFTHDGCEITAAHIANTRMAARPADRYVLRKAGPAQKIDAAIPSVLAHEALGDVTAAGLAVKKVTYFYSS